MPTSKIIYFFSVSRPAFNLQMNESRRLQPSVNLLLTGQRRSGQIRRVLNMFITVGSVCIRSTAMKLFVGRSDD